MQVSMIGLGRMGMNMARRLARGGVEVAAFNRTFEKAEALADDENGVWAIERLEDIVEEAKTPRIVWLMLPASAVDEHIEKLSGILSPGDIVIEGGNSYYKDDAHRARILEEKGIHYLDAGVSGGIWGLDEGYCLMIGGPLDVFKKIEPILSVLAPEDGYLHCGPVGSGHFVKMIHNGIEYGMMQAYAEGFDLMKAGPYSEHHDFEAISRLWMRGSVVRSWLLELLERAFKEDPNLDNLAGYVEDSGEGRWTVQQAVESSTNAPVITLSLMQRFRSRRDEVFGDKVLAALRNQFGGHAVKRS